MFLEILTVKVKLSWLLKITGFYSIKRALFIILKEELE